MNKQSETLDIAKGEESTDRVLVDRTEIEDTPFVVIGVKDEYFVSMGAYRITEPVATKAEAVEEAKVISWNRIVQVIMLIHDATQKHEGEFKDIMKGRTKTTEE